MGEDRSLVVNRIVGDNVRRSLREAGSSLRDAAESAGLSYRTVRRYATGERDMPVPVLLALMRASNSDFVRFAERLEQETAAPPPHGHPIPAGPNDVADSAGEGAEGAEGEGDGPAEASRELDARLRRLGVTQLAARSIGSIDPGELRAVGDLVEQIVLELRADPARTAAASDR